MTEKDTKYGIPSQQENNTQQMESATLFLQKIGKEEES